MASGKTVRDVLGWQVELTASWEWVPAGLLTQLVPLVRGGSFVQIEYPDATGATAAGTFAVEIGSQKIFSSLWTACPCGTTWSSPPQPRRWYGVVTMPDTYAPYTDTRRVELSFTFGVVAPDAAALATPNASGNSSVSQIKQSVDAVEEMSRDYSPWRRICGSWMGLRRSIRPRCPAYRQAGTAMPYQGDDGSYAFPPWLEFSFPSNQDSFGFTLL